MVTYVRRVLLDLTELIDCSGARSIGRTRLLLVRRVKFTDRYEESRRDDNPMTRRGVTEYISAVFVYEKVI